MRLDDRRVLVVGASSGVGQAAALAVAAEGGRVALAARRVDRLEQAVAEAGQGAFAVACDVRDEASVNAAVAEAAKELGGLDAIVYSPGISTFDPIADVDAEAWRAVLDTNLVGATLVTRAAIGHLEQSCGKAIYYSSIVIDDRPPRPCQSTYVVSKVALESLISAWQGEHRRVGFTTIAMGDTVTEFAHDEDGAKLAPIVKRWAAEGYMYGRVMNAPDVAAQVVNALASPETIRRIAMTPHYPHDEVGSASEWAKEAMRAVRGDGGD